jgi:4-alpha-glucanotransferase
VPEGNPTAEHGIWRVVPAALFDAMQAELGPPPVVADDLGVITPRSAPRREPGYPSMRRPAIRGRRGRRNPHRRESRSQSVAYTGTQRQRHDARLVESLTPRSAEHWPRRADPAWSLIERTWSSCAALAIAPLQDVLGPGARRMNPPGTDGQLAVA